MRTRNCLFPASAFKPPTSGLESAPKLGWYLGSEFFPVSQRAKLCLRCGSGFSRQGMSELQLEGKTRRRTLNYETWNGRTMKTLTIRTTIGTNRELTIPLPDDGKPDPAEGVVILTP